MWHRINTLSHCSCSSPPTPPDYYTGTGALYNWYAVDTGILAPVGWHIPSSDEVETLALAIDPTMSDCDLNSAGGALKALTDWSPPNTGATNSSGFSAKPAGKRGYVFDEDGFSLWFWQNESYWGDYSKAISSYLLYDSDKFFTHYSPFNCLHNTDKWLGISVRCLKDDSTVADMTDYDGNIYHGIKIGTQVWIDSNLRTTHYNNGNLIPLVTNQAAWEALVTGAMCWFNNIVP